MLTLNRTKRARVVQIYCPAFNTTIENFMITPSMGLDNVLMHIQASLRGYDLEDILLCDVNRELLTETATTLLLSAKSRMVSAS